MKYQGHRTSLQPNKQPPKKCITQLFAMWCDLKFCFGFFRIVTKWREGSNNLIYKQWMDKDCVYIISNHFTVAEHNIHNNWCCRDVLSCCYWLGMQWCPWTWPLEVILCVAALDFKSIKTRRPQTSGEVASVILTLLFTQHFFSQVINPPKGQPLHSESKSE